LSGAGRLRRRDEPDVAILCAEDGATGRGPR